VSSVRPGTTEAKKGSGTSDQVFVARQPILDRSRRVYAYELLFRPSIVAETSESASERASARVITDAVLAFGLDTLTQGKPAFINVTRRLLLEGIPGALPPTRVVIELLEDVEADEEVVAACRELRRAGYAIALDDFVLNERTAGLLPLADFVKVDCLASAPAIKQRLSSPSHQAALLAEKIETVAQFEKATSLGFTYFQGFFFGKPVTQGAREVPGHRLGHLRLLRALHDPNLTVIQLEELIKHDALLCYRVLRTVNSAGFAQQMKIESIRQALVLLGIDTVRRWAALWVLAGLSAEAHPELVTMSTVRARCCELLAQTTRGPDYAAEGFLLGMCSLLDAILQRPMEVILGELPLPDEIMAALSGAENQSRSLLDCTVAYERGEFDRCLYLAGRAGLDPKQLPIAHRDALRWAADFKHGA